MLDAYNMEEEPSVEKMDSYKNLLVWEINQKKWSIVSYEVFLMFRQCWSHWSYLPTEPECGIREPHIRIL